MQEKPDRQHLIFMDLFFLLYSIYDGVDDMSKMIKLLEEHMDHFS